VSAGSLIPIHHLDGDLLPSHAELQQKFRRCSVLHDHDREFVFRLLEAMKDLTATNPVKAPGLNLSQVFYAILAGSAPGVNAIVSGNLPGMGAFTLRSDGGFLLDLVVMRSNVGRAPSPLGDRGTVLRYRAPGQLRQGWDDYREALRIVQAVIDGDSVFLSGVTGNVQGLLSQRQGGGGHALQAGEGLR
jgi:hypothetical protein